MNYYPHITVATVVPQQGRFLMVQEKSGESLVYNQPAGHVEVGEG
ncbi:MAG: NUDIX hydrolase, partial [Pseudomonadota bacterium]|nr:NUDIX hydrolase [Pseudomonadota bacterium]